MNIFGKKPKDKANRDERIYEQWQLDEIIKCSIDPIYFIITYCKIIHKDRGLIPFILHDYQIEYINMIHTNRFSVIMFPRQTGKTTTMCGYIAWYTIFNSNKTVCVMANKEDTAKEVLLRLKDIIVNLPEWLKPWIENWAATQITFKNGNRIKISSSSESAVRGIAGNIIYLDEFAHLSGGGQLQELFYTSVYPTIISGQSTKLIISSCVSDDTIVYTDKGPSYISEFIDYKHQSGGYEISEYRVLGFNGINKGNVFHNDGEKPTRIIKTSCSELESSLNHKYLAFKNGTYGIFRAHELEVGDYISLKKGMDLWGSGDSIADCLRDDCAKPNRNGRLRDRYFISKKIDRELAYLVGVVIACAVKITANTVTITTKNDLREGIEKTGLHCKRKGRTGNGEYIFLIHSKSFVDILRGLGVKASNKIKSNRKISPRLMHMSRECMAGLISGIIDESIMYYKQHNKKVIYPRTKELGRQLRAIALNFGVLLRDFYRPKARKASLYIPNGDNSTKYHDIIGTNVNNIKNMFELMVSHYTPVHVDQDIIPGSGIALNGYYKDGKVATTSVEPLPCRDDLTRKYMVRLKKRMRIPKELKPLFDMVDENIHWLKITSIDENINKVYDFSMYSTDDEWGHSVIYNGVIGEQTPNGTDLFHKIYSKALKKENQFKAMTITWDACPGRDETFKKNTIQDIGQLQWDQEFECKFVGSQATLIDPDLLASMDNSDPVHVDWDGMLKVYNHALDVEDMDNKGWFYLVSVDPCMGTRKDFGVAQVLLVRSNMDIEQVAVMSTNNKNPVDFANYVARLCKIYNMAKVIVETNGEAGAMVSNTLRREIQYPEMIRLDNTGGFSSNSKTKREAYTALKIYIEGGHMKIKDRATINELYSFVKIGNTYKADGTNHDDHVTSMFPGIAYIRSNKFYGNIDDKSLHYKDISKFDSIDINNNATILRPSTVYNSDAIESMPEGKEKDAIVKLINRPNLDSKGPASISIINPFDMGNRFVSGQQYVNDTYAPGFEGYRDIWPDEGDDFGTKILI